MGRFMERKQVSAARLSSFGDAPIPYRHAADQQPFDAAQAAVMLGRAEASSGQCRHRGNIR